MQGHDWGSWDGNRCCLNCGIHYTNKHLPCDPKEKPTPSAAEKPKKDKREVILEFHSSPDAILNALHQAGWQVIPHHSGQAVDDPASVGLTAEGERIAPIQGDPPCNEYDPAGEGAGVEYDGQPQCAQCGYAKALHTLPRHSGQVVDDHSKHGVEYPKCEGCGDSIPGIIRTETGLCHEMCCKDTDTEQAVDRQISDGGSGRRSPVAQDDNSGDKITLQPPSENYWQDRFDLLRDEFLRIAACPNVTDEIEGICKRAEQDIRRCVPLIDELAAECQRAEQAERQVDRLLQTNANRHQQLLSALAAIEDHNKRGKESNTPCYEINVDLSLLHEHDAALTEKVRTPLVEALLYLRDFIQDDEQYFDNLRRIDALAQCKQP